MNQKSLENELERLKILRDQNHWDTTRNQKNFERKKIDSFLGERVIWVPKDDNHNKDLQSSRSVSLRDVEEIKDIEKTYDAEMTMTHTDLLRAEELEECIHTWNKFGEQSGIGNFNPTGMCEIGFRYPRLMSYYNKRYDIPVIGYDISKIAVEFGKSKNFNVYECDLNNLKENNLNFYDSNIVCMYHVLEHVQNPIETMKGICSSMNKNTFFHIEVPIELDNPQVEFGHLFGFHSGDLLRICQNIGLTTFSVVQKNIAGAIMIERVGCIVR